MNKLNCPSDAQVAELEKIAYELRSDVIDMITEAGSGHPAGSLGTAEIFSALYFYVLNIDPKNPEDTNRDRFILSNGHICPIWYATLSKAGFFPRSDLWTLRKLGSALQGHPHVGSLPGVENTSGSLGQGLSVAIGIALSALLDDKNFYTYCMTGDGELDEGQVWEAAMFAGNYPLTNLIWIIDRNNIQSDDFTEKVMPLEVLRDKLESFNFYVEEIDGHNVQEIINSCYMAKAVRQRPTAIIAHTIPGKGVEFMEYQVEWHGKPTNKDQAQKALKELRSLRGKIGIHE